MNENERMSKQASRAEMNKMQEMSKRSKEGERQVGRAFLSFQKKLEVTSKKIGKKE